MMKDKGGFVFGELIVVDFVLMYGVFFGFVLYISKDLKNVEVYYISIVFCFKFQVVMGDLFQVLEVMVEMILGQWF